MVTVNLYTKSTKVVNNELSGRAGERSREPRWNRTGEHKSPVHPCKSQVSTESDKTPGSGTESRPSPVLLSSPSLPTSLVNERNNSSKTCSESPILEDVLDESISQNSPKNDKLCPNGSWFKGKCGHGRTRWRYVPCKKRDCEICGPVGRYRIAERIALGIRQYGPCAWLVLTFAEDIDKKRAVRLLNSFVKWLRKKTATALEYVATYELTQRGRLHINLIIGPWKFIDQAQLQKRWGARISVEWVKDARQIGRETAKAYSPEGLGGYISKLEQAVPTDRRVSYSKNWPKLPEGGLKRKGKIKWSPVMSEGDLNEMLSFLGDKEVGYWREVLPGEWKSLVSPEECECFDFITA